MAPLFPPVNEEPAFSRACLIMHKSPLKNSDSPTYPALVWPPGRSGAAVITYYGCPPPHVTTLHHHPLRTATCCCAFLKVFLGKLKHHRRPSSDASQREWREVSTPTSKHVSGRTVRSNEKPCSTTAGPRPDVFPFTFGCCRRQGLDHEIDAGSGFHCRDSWWPTARCFQ